MLHVPCCGKRPLLMEKFKYLIIFFFKITHKFILPQKISIHITVYCISGNTPQLGSVIYCFLYTVREREAQILRIIYFPDVFWRLL